MIYKANQHERQMIINWVYIHKLWHTKHNVSNDQLATMYTHLTGTKVYKSKACAYLWLYITTNSSFKGCEVYTNKKKSRRNKHPYNKKVNFYQTREWRELRVEALVKYGRKCCLCGRTVGDGVVLHVDHIKPRSKFPQLELVLSNMQILCEDCNMGKSNHYSDKWR